MVFDYFVEKKDNKKHLKFIVKHFSNQFSRSCDRNWTTKGTYEQSCGKARSFVIFELKMRSQKRKPNKLDSWKPEIKEFPTPNRLLPSSIFEFSLRFSFHICGEAGSWKLKFIAIFREKWETRSWKLIKEWKARIWN